MIIYTNTSSKKTRKQKVKQKLAWKQQQTKYGVQKSVSFRTYKPEQQTSLRSGSNQWKTIKSADSASFDTFKRERPVYTGDAMIGIATLHKSNAVPVFSEQDAKDISKMRRG
jgi:hypothetical protein